MQFLRPSLFGVVVAFCAGGIGVELWQLREAAQAARRALVRLEEKKQERDWLMRQAPAPNAASEAAMAAERETLRTRIDALRRGLMPPPPASPPARSMDAYFELADFTEKARARAVAGGIALPPDERFGFSRYAKEGPPSGLLASVHRQQHAVGQLLEPLFEARPHALLGVRRERPAGAEAGGQSGGEDYFTLDPGLSVRRAGLIETEALRCEFTGQTATLRIFLSGLAVGREPAVVRSVGVEPLPPAGGPSAASVPAGLSPVVRQGLSRFVVTVEFLLPAAVSAGSVP